MAWHFGINLKCVLRFHYSAQEISRHISSVRICSLRREEWRDRAALTETDDIRPPSNHSWNIRRYFHVLFAAPRLLWNITKHCLRNCTFDSEAVGYSLSLSWANSVELQPTFQFPVHIHGITRPPLGMAAMAVLLNVHTALGDSVALYEWFIYRT